MESHHLTFETFYTSIKEHFSSSTNDDYDAFRNEKLIGRRLKYLIDHAFVSKMLSTLERSKTVFKTKPKKGEEDEEEEEEEEGEEKKEEEATSAWMMMMMMKKRKTKTLQSPLNPKSEHFPQMSSKIKLGQSAKSGRCLVAKEKINTGK